LAPFTVRANAADPAGTLDGATDEMEGVAAEGEVGDPGVFVEEVPPQPVNTRQEKRQRTTTASTQQPTHLMGLGLSYRVCGGRNRHTMFASANPGLARLSINLLLHILPDPNFPIWDLDGWHELLGRWH
jgi:hypothetical protein